MIHPTRQLKAERYIHAAPAAVWQKFIKLTEWPAWYPGLSSALWQQSEQWQEGAHFTIDTRQGQRLHFVIRMVSPGSVTVWEALSPARSVVYAFHCTDQVGGCKVTMSCTYHGLAALATWLPFGRAQAQVAEPLDALKAYFERK